MARRMLESCLANPATEQDKVDLLLEGLAFLPLAVVQAATYINVNKITVQEYLSLLSDKKSGMTDDLGPKSENVMDATWLISFEQIRRQDALAAGHLLFMACVDRHNIPIALLLEISPDEQGVQAVEALKAYSLITVRTAESAVDLHRLVHTSTRNWLEKGGVLNQQTHETISRLHGVFPDSDHGNRIKWRRLLPHAMLAPSASIMKFDSQIFENRRKWKEVLPHAVFALLSGMMKASDEVKIELAHKCADAFYSDGQWKEAKELEVHVLDTRKKALGEDHLDTTRGINNLTSTFQQQGWWKEAAELQLHVIETCKRVLGEEHLHVN